jgi:NAD(P)-dependent dehydrogenase (short-subunit alcohol dehydrogenase family)
MIGARTARALVELGHDIIVTAHRRGEVLDERHDIV